MPAAAAAASGSGRRQGKFSDKIEDRKRQVGEVNCCDICGVKTASHYLTAAHIIAHGFREVR